MRIAVNRSIPRPPSHRRRWLARGAPWLLLPVFGLLGFMAHKHQWHQPTLAKALAALEPQRLVSLLHDPELPTLYIDVKYKHFRRIQQKRSQALQAGLLLSDSADYVPARLSAGGAETVRAAVRLKGDFPDHWNTDKWSYRIKIKDSGSVLGMSEFSIQHPATRNYAYNFLFHEHARDLGLIVPRTGLVQVVFNGEPKGLYTLEEHFTQEMLEHNRRRPGIIMARSEHEFYEHWVQTGMSYGGLRPDMIHTADVHIYDDKDVESSEALRRQRPEAISRYRSFVEGRQPLDEVVDLRQWARFYALCELYQGTHALINARYYYNAITGRIEPVAYDPAVLKSHAEALIVNQSQQPDRLFSDGDFVALFLEELRRLSEPAAFQDHLDRVKPRFEYWNGLLKREFLAENKMTAPWSKLRRRAELIQVVLQPANPVLAYVDPPAVGSTALPPLTHEIGIRNLLLLPLEVVGFRIGNGPLIAAGAVATEDSANIRRSRLNEAVYVQPEPATGERPYARFRIPGVHVSATADATVTVVTRLPGDPKTVSSVARPTPAPSWVSHRPPGPTVAQFQARFPDARLDEHTVTLPRRTWHLTEDLITPQGYTLVVEAGARLEFDPETVLLTTGPIRLAGTAEQPIVLTAAQSTWAGLLVLQAGEPSLLRHSRIEHTAGIDRDGWSTSGGVTFYDSPVTIHDCAFLDSQAIDSLNLVRSDFDLGRTRFSGCASDALDADFCNGQVWHCAFFDARGDGLDFSGADVRVSDSRFDDIADKAVSCGEHSRISARRLDISRTRIAVASKDHSEALLEDIRITDGDIGLAAYQKKSHFGPATLRAQQVHLERVDRPVLLEEGSTLELDGHAQPAQRLDVKQLLYATEPHAAGPVGLQAAATSATAPE